MKEDDIVLVRTGFHPNPTEPRRGRRRPLGKNWRRRTSETKKGGAGKRKLGVGDIGVHWLEIG
jgi:hypothetical protein